MLLLDVASPTPHGSVEPSLELEYAPPTCQATAPTSQGQYVDNPHSQVHVLANVDAAAGGLIEGNSRRTTGTGGQTQAGCYCDKSPADCVVAPCWTRRTK